jgi:hypothetical protein
MSKKEDIRKLRVRVQDLEEELNNQTRGMATPYDPFYFSSGNATLNGKLEAIAVHLGIEFEVQQEKVVGAKVSVKKVKK